MATRIRGAVEEIDLSQAPGLRCSVSTGLAKASGNRLREWIGSAQRALYRAKQTGRHRTPSDLSIAIDTR